MANPVLFSAGAAALVAASALLYWIADAGSHRRALREAQTANVIYDCGFSDLELDRYIRQARGRGIPDWTGAGEQVVASMKAGCPGPTPKQAE